MKYFFAFFINDSVHLIITAAMFIMLRASKVTSRYNKRIFYLLLSLNTLFLIVDYVDTVIGNAVISPKYLPLCVQVRNVSAGLCYCLKTLELLLLMYALIAPKKKLHIAIAVPATFACLLCLSSIFTGWVYFISADNLFHNGPLKNVYLVIVFAYLVCLPLLSLLDRRKANPVRTSTVLLITVLLALTTLSGLLNLYKFNLLGMSIIVCIMLYFLFDFMQRSEMVIEDKDRQLQLQQIELANSQIQPHFLYNTLSVVCGLCRIDPPLAEDTLIKFSNYLRDNLTYSKTRNPMIPIEKELEHTRIYTDIEKIRFRHLTVEYDIRDSNYSVPFLTVQPMVENAIRHGVRGLANGKVTVTLCPFEKDGVPMHRITVQDNGTGKPLSENLGEHKGIGILNVTNRIESLCGGTVAIDFAPTGTTVVIELPDVPLHPVPDRLTE